MPTRQPAKYHVTVLKVTIVWHLMGRYGRGQIGFVSGTRVASTRSRQQGKKQGVIQSGENRVLLLLSRPFFNDPRDLNLSAANRSAALQSPICKGDEL